MAQSMLAAAGRSLGLLPSGGASRGGWGGPSSWGVGAPGAGLLDGGAAGGGAMQARGGIEVAVMYDNVEGAMRLLNRKQKEERILRRQADGRFHTSRAEQRKLDKKESKRRLERKAYKRLLGFVLRRKMRGF
eukprot:jgi/Tetstr1/443839/TSEL_031793.t1